MDELRKLLEDSLTEGLYQIVVSGPRCVEGASKIKVRPVVLREGLRFQLCFYVGKQVLHENLTDKEAAGRLKEEVITRFRQMEVETVAFRAVALVSKKGKVSIKIKNRLQEIPRKIELSHNRVKQYILEEGKPIPFLVDLGVQTPTGKVISGRYDKFRQINRFLEFIRDIVPILPKDRPIHIVDFGCGKSYLTFAMYYFLHQLCKLDVKITGLDLKKDVIEQCNRLAERYGYEGIHFLQGDIADYVNEESVDMVVSLHACDTATDFALYKAICWQAQVILCVPCCQHEANGQICSEPLEGALRYGLLRERLSALFTDALRADLLEEAGYETQVLEFIEMEHTPKNILLRAVKRENRKSRDVGAGKLSEALGIHITLQRLLEEREE